jgi:hypothetical protein
MFGKKKDEVSGFMVFGSRNVKLPLPSIVNV